METETEFSFTLAHAASETSSKTLFFDNTADAVAAAAPEGSTVRAIGFERVDGFLRAGYRVVDGDADIIVARGGEREFDIARRTNCTKLILAPTHAYSAAACGRYATRDKAFAVMKSGQKPYAAVFDPNDTDNNLASIFGEIVSLDLAVFDLNFGAYMRGERVDVGLAENVARLITELTAALKPLEKNRAEQRRALVNAGKHAARITEETPQLLHVSGAAQATEAHRMLCTAEDRPIGMRGETEMLFGAYVSDFYIKNLTDNLFRFPPDNNKRIDSICEYFNADVRRACVYTSPIFPPQKLRLYEYRMKEFRPEQMRMLSEIGKRRAAAWQVFKRLYPDDGYCLKTLIDKTDVGLCIALAPDVFPAETMLSYLKQSGALEKYIV